MAAFTLKVTSFKLEMTFELLLICNHKQMPNKIINLKDVSIKDSNLRLSVVHKLNYTQQLFKEHLSLHVPMCKTTTGIYVF